MIKTWSHASIDLKITVINNRYVGHNAIDGKKKNKKVKNTSRLMNDKNKKTKKNRTSRCRAR